jgi:hypothetical protein
VRIGGHSTGMSIPAVFFLEMNPIKLTKLFLATFSEFQWDVVVAFEDVKSTKPYGDGVDKAMFSISYSDRTKVVLAEDGDSDIRSAYNAECVAVLERST